MFEAGQRVKVIGDSFTQDPHGVPIGEKIVIERINEPIKFEDFPPVIKMVFAMSGNTGEFDLPERAHATYGDEKVNIPLEDLAPIRVKMLEDDYAEGYSKGDIFEIIYSPDDEKFFRDNDGDVRYLADHEYEEI